METGKRKRLHVCGLSVGSMDVPHGLGRLGWLRNQSGHPMPPCTCRVPGESQDASSSTAFPSPSPPGLEHGGPMWQLS